MSKKKRRHQPPAVVQGKLSAISSKTFTVAAILLICLLGAVIYSNSLEGPFVFDDINNIEENPAVHITELGPSRLVEAARGGRAPRPVAYFTFALNFYFGGFDVTGYHVVNVVIHLANGVLVFFLASLTYRLFIGGNQGKLATSEDNTVGWLSLFAACLFVAHPLQTQAVTYLVQRMTSLSAMFYLLALLLYIRGRLKPVGRERWAFWAGCFASGILAMGSKQIAITLPAVILLYEWYFFQDLNKAWATRQVKYLLVLFVFLVGVSLMFLGTSPLERMANQYSIRDYTMGERVLTQFRVVVDYITLALVPLPSRLNLLHNVTTSRSLIDPITTLLSLLTITALIGLGIYLARRQRLISFCILWFFANLALESSIIALEMFYEHRVYLPMFGVALMVPYLLHRFLEKQPNITATIACVLILSLGFGTYVRNQVWQDTMLLWTDVVEKDPTFPGGYIQRAHAFRRAEKFDLAIPEYTKAIELGADDAAIHNHRGIVYGQMGRAQLAVADFNKAIKLAPEEAAGYTNRGHTYRQIGKFQMAINNYTKAIELQADHVEAYNNRGAVYHHLGDLERALRDYSKAIELKPGYAPVYNNRGNIYSEMQNYDQAITDYSKTLELAPGFAPAYTNRGQAYQKLGKNKLAIADCQQAIAIQPDLMPAFESLAWLLSSSPELSLRDGKQAVDYAKRACQLSNWKNPECLDALAAAYAESGSFSDAIKWQSKALLNAPPNLLLPMRKRLELYQANQPYRQELSSDVVTLPKGGE